MITVKDIAKRKNGIPEDTPINKFIESIKKSRTSFSAVIDKDSRVVGIVTEKDLIKLVSFGVHGSQAFYDRQMSRRLMNDPVSAIMTKNPVTIKYNATPDEAMRLMAKQGFRRLIVVDDRERLVGSVRIADIVSKAVE